MRICFVGDSLTNGTGDDDALGWPGRIVARARAAGRDVTYYNLGIRRETSADIAARWRTEVERRLPPEFPRRLAFSFGNNDCRIVDGAPRVAFERAVANTERILTEAAAFAPTVTIGPLPAPDADETDRRIRVLAAAQRDVCDRLGVPFLDVFDFAHACEPWRRSALAGDGAHPGSEGYAALADFIWGWPALQSWLDEK